MIQGHSSTTWGQPVKEIDTRALRAYRLLLVRIANIGETLYFSLLVSFVLVSIWLLAFANLESIIFYDGTANTCVLDGATQEIFHVQ